MTPDLENLLYPQYRDRYPAWDALLARHRAELAAAARRLLAAHQRGEGPRAVAAVVAHWRRLARG